MIENNFQPLHFSTSPRVSFNQATMSQAKMGNENGSYSKKRIGEYSYYLKELIGSGYTSSVYKCYKNNNKSQIFAIKVVGMGKITRTEYHLLQNQIHILKQLDHQNVIRFHDVYYTKNNVYIITDYCEGGTLENYVSVQKQNLQYTEGWENIFLQILKGCQYLTSQLIMHRDIKPANIFLKDGIWKIGDFGFSKRLSHKFEQIHEQYTIGSPLYMPPETLKNNIYSLKTDSFALGVTLFNLMTGEFPWPGNNSNHQLLQAYSLQQFPGQKIPNKINDFMRKLCDIDLEDRAHTDFINLEDLQFSPKSESQQSTINEEESWQERLQILHNLNIVEKVKLCKFISYLKINLKQYPDTFQLNKGINSVLHSISIVFQSQNIHMLNEYLVGLKNNDETAFLALTEAQQIIETLKKEVKSFQSSQATINKFISLKLRQFIKILELIREGNQEKIKELISWMVLHPKFSKF